LRVVDYALYYTDRLETGFKGSGSHVEVGIYICQFFNYGASASIFEQG
jgi:hypothetical protein